MNQEYSYETAGFDAFLTRSIDGVGQVSLNSQGPQSTQIRYDSSQVSGMLGDTLQMGNVTINKTNIIVSDGQNDRLLLGEDENGF